MTDWICPRSCSFAGVEQPRLQQIVEREPEANVTCPKCLTRFPAASYGRKRFAGPLHRRVPTSPVQRIEKLHAALYDKMVLDAEIAALQARLIKAGVLDPQAYDKVLDHLARVRITVNLPLKNLLFILDDAQLKNVFQLPEAAHAGMPVEKYFHERNQSEKTLFGTPELRPEDLPKAYTGGAKHGPAYQLGLWNDPARSDTSDRPTYAALNIACYAGGAAPVYGTSHFVLKDHLRRHCTFTAGDSLEHHWKKKLSSVSVATARSYHKVLLYMNQDALAFIGKLATGVHPRDLPLRYQQYVEVQIWKTIDFDSDVAQLCVDIDEINLWIEGRDLPNDLWKVPKSRDGRAGLALSLQTGLRIFCRRHNIELNYYRSGKCASLSFANENVYRVVG